MIKLQEIILAESQNRVYIFAQDIRHMPIVEANTKRIVARRERDGWSNLGGGKHDKFGHPEHRHVIVVPRHSEQSPGVARSIAKAAGWI